MERKIKISEELVSGSFSRMLDQDVVSVVIINEGTKNAYVGMNEKAEEGKGTLEPGSSTAYGYTWPYFLTDNRLSIEFASGAGTNKVLLKISRDAGPNC